MAITRLCSVSDCGKTAKHLGMCDMHYRRRLRHGSPTGGRKTFRNTTIQWINDHLGLADGDCLIWPFGLSSNGYGSVRIGGKVHNASRYICEQVNGAPPSDRHEAAHSCGMGHAGCVHPRHLYWGTSTENHADMIGHGTVVRGVDAHNALLNEDAVRTIRRLQGTVSRQHLADRFGVSVATITAVILRKNWAWVR